MGAVTGARRHRARLGDHLDPAWHAATEAERTTRRIDRLEVIFARPLPMDWQLLDGTALADRISAITWCTPFNEAVLVRTWHRATSSDPYHVRARYRDLIASLVNPECFRTTPPPATPVRLLQGLTGLLRTNFVTATSASPFKRAGPPARGRQTTAAHIRRLYLRHPEHGSQELDALRSERDRAPRGHWVRGHWRNQWFPSIDEHPLDLDSRIPSRRLHPRHLHRRTSPCRPITQDCSATDLVACRYPNSQPRQYDGTPGPAQGSSPQRHPRRLRAGMCLSPRGFQARRAMVDMGRAASSQRAPSGCRAIAFRCLEVNVDIPRPAATRRSLCRSLTSRWRAAGERPGSPGPEEPRGRLACIRCRRREQTGSAGLDAWLAIG
jgi:hypothetical protein